MSLLLDTHVWVWSQENTERIGAQARQQLLNTEELLFVATISSLEIARLLQVGLLELEGELRDWINASIDALQCSTLELSHAVAVGAYLLPGKFHKDPADRILVAMAREHELSLMTADERILAYAGVDSIDARV